MKRKILVTGANSGIGKATVELLRLKGHDLITTDLNEADINVDLSESEGRTRLIEEVRKLCGDSSLDGIVAAAGLSASAPAKKVLAVNYFGVSRLLDGLRPLLAKSKSPRAVVIASTAVFTPTPADAALIELMLSDDEEGALNRVCETKDYVSYPSSKKAIALWVRRTAVTPEWAGQNILLNAIGPGRTNTPMIAELLASEEGRKILDDATPMALPKPYAEPEEIAILIASMLETETSLIVGQILYADGGTDALRRPNHV